MSMQVVRALPEEKWSQFLLENPAGNVFLTPEMYRVFERAQGHEPKLWAVVGDADHILALMVPVHITVFDGLLSRLTTRAVAFGSVVWSDDDEGPKALKLLLAQYREAIGNRILYTELRNLRAMNGVQPILEAEGFAYEDHLNYLIDLERPIEEIMQSIGRRTRKHIRRGLRAGNVTIEEVSDKQGLAECYRLLQMTYSGADIPLADSSLFEAAFDLLSPKKMVRFSLARVEGHPAACSVELLYRDVAYGWYGGMDRQYAAHMPNEILTWCVLEWAAQNGYRLYDFGGAGKPDEEYGVRYFKAKFGGDMVSYGRNTCVHAPLLLNASKLGYDVFRRLGLFSTTD